MLAVERDQDPADVDLRALLCVLDGGTDGECGPLHVHDDSRFDPQGVCLPHSKDLRQLAIGGVGDNDLDPARSEIQSNEDLTSSHERASLPGAPSERAYESLTTT